MPCLKDNLVRHFEENIPFNDIPIRIHIGLEDPQDLITIYLVL